MLVQSALSVLWPDYCVMCDVVYEQLYASTCSRTIIRWTVNRNYNYSRGQLSF